MRPIRIPRLTLLITMAAMAAIAALTACSGPASEHPAAIKAAAQAPPTYYLALGDSLAQGVQPDAAGTSVETGDGYPDQVYATLRRSHPTLKLVKLGCPGETTVSMINGGMCRYPSGSQLKAAVAFLQEHRVQEHRGRVLLVTIDIGANDPEACSGQPSFSQLAVCAVKGVPSAVTHLATIVARLRAAAGPGVRIVGMNYYLPALAEWRDGLSGHAVAWTAERLAATFNALLGRVYKKAGIRVANVFAAFQTSDFDRHGTNLPHRPVRAAARLCPLHQREHAERPGQDQPRRGDRRAGALQRRPHRLPQRDTAGLLPDPGHDQDVVVLAQRQQEQEHEERDEVRQASGARTALEQHHRQAERGQVAQHHRGDEVDRGDHAPQDQPEQEGSSPPISASPSRCCPRHCASPARSASGCSFPSAPSTATSAAS